MEYTYHIKQIDDTGNCQDVLSRSFLRTEALYPRCENTVCSSSQLASPQELTSIEGSFLTQGYVMLPFQRKPTSNKWTMRGIRASPLVSIQKNSEEPSQVQSSIFRKLIASQSNFSLFQSCFIHFLMSIFPKSTPSRSSACNLCPFDMFPFISEQLLPFWHVKTMQAYCPTFPALELVISKEALFLNQKKRL